MWRDRFRSVVQGCDLREGVSRLLEEQERHDTLTHVRNVAEEAVRLAKRFGACPGDADTAGLLHDIAAAMPASEYAGVLHAGGGEVLPEEETYPPILHQKVSVLVAREVFGVGGQAILSAIGCHTTLKPGASDLDKVVFLADKIAWDQPCVPPYRDRLLAALDLSLDAAALVYLEFLWQQRATLKVVHPWMAAAYRELQARGRYRR